MRRLVLLAAVGVAAAACGDDRNTTRSADGLDGTVTVLAAASLTDSFTELAERFEVEHPGIDVRLSSGGSSSLREQILAGAPADVFASANQPNMDRLLDAGAVVDPVPFATNQLRIAVPEGNPAGITGLTDFAEPELLLGLCTPDVPCGELARQVLDAAGVDPAVDTEEPDVRALLTKIRAGELDAGIVYVSDVASSGAEVEGIEIPNGQGLLATYPIAVTADARNRRGAEAFVGLVRSADGAAVLERYGFGVR